MLDEKKLKEKQSRKVGIFIKVNFINSFNKFKNDKETQKKIEQETIGD